MNERPARQTLPTELDDLGFDPVVQAVARKIWADPSEPLNVGVFGEWGSGKSSFLRQLKKKLRETPNSQEVLLVDFAPWRFQHGADPAIALVNAMMGAHPEKLGGKVKSAWESLRSQLNSISFKLDFNVAGVGPEFGTEIDGQKAAEAHSATKRRLETARYGGILEPRYFLHEAVRIAFEKLQTLTVIFVDDLDRCLDEEVVEVLEAIKTVFEVKYCTFVIAADPCIIRRAVARRVGSEQAAEHYLEKFLDVSITVPFVTKELQALDRFFNRLRLSWRPAESPPDPVFFVRKRILDDLFLRGVRPNPRDMVQAAEKFDLLKNVVEADTSGRLKTIVDDLLLLKVALLQNLLGERFNVLAKDPGLLRQWELGTGRPASLDEDGQRLMSEILKPIEPGPFSAGSFAALDEHDLHVYSFLAAHDAERAFFAVKKAFLDVSNRIASIAEDLAGVSLSPDHAGTNFSAFERIVLPLRRAMKLRFEVPPDIQATFAALIEVARSGEDQRKKVKSFFDQYLCNNLREFFPLIRWEIVTRLTTLQDDAQASETLIGIIRQRAGRLVKEKLDPSATRKILLADTEVLREMGNLVRVSRRPVTNSQYESLDPGHAVLRHSHGMSPEEAVDKGWSDTSVSMVNLIDAALFCEWLNCGRRNGDPWAALPKFNDWHQVMTSRASHQGSKIEKVVRDVWEWTRTPLGGINNKDALIEQSLPCVWTCGGSWYQQSWTTGVKSGDQVASAINQKLWFSPMHQRLDVGFRVFWYTEDPCQS